MPNVSTPKIAIENHRTGRETPLKSQKITKPIMFSIANNR